MIYKLPVLTLLVSLFLGSCKEPNTISTPEDSRKLNTARTIAVEIEEEHGIEGDPYLRFDGVAQIELNMTDPKLDYRSIVPKIAELKSVQSFEGELQLLFQMQNKGKRPRNP